MSNKKNYTWHKSSNIVVNSADIYDGIGNTGSSFFQVAESSNQLKVKTSNGITKPKVPSSSKNEEVKKSREPSTDRNNVKKSVTSQKTTKKVESSRTKVSETPKTRSNVGTNKTTVSKTASNINSTPRTTVSKSTVKPVKPMKAVVTPTISSSRSNTSVSMKGTKSSSRDVTSKRVTKEQYFPKKYPFSSYLHENEENKSDRKVKKPEKIEQKITKKISEESPSPKLKRERTMTRILSPSEVKVIKNIVETKSENSSSDNRPRTATIRKHDNENIEENLIIETPLENKNTEPEIENEEADYEDDFDSYESDFENYSSSSSTSPSDIDTSTSSTSTSSEEKLIELTQKRTNSAGNEEERKLDSGNYDLPDIKHKQILDKIKEAVERENSNLNKINSETVSNLASLSDEGFEEGSKHSLVHTGFINFMDAKKKQQQKKLNLKSRKRGDDLMEMIRLNHVYFSVFDMKAISYDEFMQSYGKSGTIQVSSQTGDDDIDEEVQTENIEMLSKSTQFPIRFSKEEYFPTEEHLNSENEMTWECDATTLKKLNKFMEKTGRIVLNILEQKQIKSEQIKKNESDLPFSDGFFSLNFDNTPFLKDRKIIHMTHSKHSKLLTIHESNTQVHMDKNAQLLSRSTICVWDICEPAYPLHILVSSGEITKACFESNYGFLIFAGICDGSVCVWDLREDSKLHPLIYEEKTDKSHCLKSPTYTAVATVDTERNSGKIIAIQSYFEKETTYFVSQRNISGIQIATLDESGVIVIWSVIQKQAIPELLSEDQGLIPWGCVLLVQGLVVNLQKINSNLNELQCFDLQFSETDFNHLYVASNYGVLHCLTSGMKPKPKIYSSDKSAVRCVEMAPFSPIHFLSGCENGNIKLHSRFYEKPLMTLCSTDEENKLEENIQLIEWSNNRPCVFFVKDKSNYIHIWDLTASDMYPIYSIPFTEEIFDIKFLSSNKYLAIASKNGVRIHTVNKEFSQITPDKYKTELNIFLNYANRL